MLPNCSVDCAGVSRRGTALHSPDRIYATPPKYISLSGEHTLSPITSHHAILDHVEAVRVLPAIITLRGQLLETSLVILRLYQLTGGILKHRSEPPTSRIANPTTAPGAKPPFTADPEAVRLAVEAHRLEYGYL